jgi:pimeloyl-ACP methyl ester carboxylesterase
MMSNQRYNAAAGAAATLAAALMLSPALGYAQKPAAIPPAPLATQFLDLPAGRVAFDDTGGDGPVFICVPGLGDLREQYRYLRPLLTADGFRVVTMDLRGMGESSTGWPSYTPANVGADIVALIRHLGVPRVYVVGNSMAGGSTVWAAAEVPDRIAGLVLIDPFVGTEPGVSFAMRTLMHVLFQRPWGPALWRRYYKSLYKSAPPPDLDEYADHLEANLAKPGRFEALQGMIWSSQAPCAARLDQVRAPVLVVMGSEDPDFDDPQAQARSVANRLHGKILIVSGAGHYPHVEFPKTVASEIDAFAASTK